MLQNKIHKQIKDNEHPIPKLNNLKKSKQPRLPNNSSNKNALNTQLTRSMKFQVTIVILFIVKAKTGRNIKITKIMEKKKTETNHSNCNSNKKVKNYSMIHLSISIETNYKMIKLGSLNIKTTSIIISILEDPRETEKDTRINNNKQLESFKITRFPTINGNHKSNYSSSTTINHNKTELVTQMSSTINSIIKKDFSLKARPKINMH